MGNSSHKNANFQHPLFRFGSPGAVEELQCHNCVSHEGKEKQTVHAHVARVSCEGKCYKSFPGLFPFHFKTAAQTT